MPEKEVIEMLIEGGKASPGPTTAPKLAMYKLNAGDVFKQVNERTKDYAGMKVPVKIIIDKSSKEFEIKIGTPPVSSLIKKEIGIEKAKAPEKKAAAVEGAPKEEAAVEGGKEKKTVKTETKPEVVVLGSLTMEQVLKITKLKMGDLLAKDLKAAAKMVVGTAVSMTGIMVENKSPKMVIEEIDEGKWDHLFK